MFNNSFTLAKLNIKKALDNQLVADPVVSETSQEPEHAVAKPKKQAESISRVPIDKEKQ